MFVDMEIFGEGAFVSEMELFTLGDLRGDSWIGKALREFHILTSCIHDCECVHA